MFAAESPDLSSEIHVREVEWHRRKLGHIEPSPPRQLNWWERSVLEGIGDVAGKRVLDLGCGDGEISLALLSAGAEVTAIDITPTLVEVANERVKQFLPGKEADIRVAPAESLPFEDDWFDVVVGKWVLHHVDLPQAIYEIRRVLKPGGLGVFNETSALNPVLALARRRIVSKGRLGTRQYGTPDEHPLTRADLRYIDEQFATTKVDHPDFFLLHIFDRNVLKFRSKPWTLRLLRADAWIGRRLPCLGPLSYYMRVRVTKESHEGPESGR